MMTDEEINAEIRKQDEKYFTDELLDDLKFYQQDMALMQRLKRDHPKLTESINPIIADEYGIIHEKRKELEERESEARKS